MYCVPQALRTTLTMPTLPRQLWLRINMACNIYNHNSVEIKNAWPTWLKGNIERKVQKNLFAMSFINIESCHSYWSTDHFQPIFPSSETRGQHKRVLQGNTARTCDNILLEIKFHKVRVFVWTCVLQGNTVWTSDNTALEKFYKVRVCCPILILDRKNFAGKLYARVERQIRPYR